MNRESVERSIRDVIFLEYQVPNSNIIDLRAVCDSLDLDLFLPSIALNWDTAVACKKHREAVQAWDGAPHKSVDQLVAAWDVLQTALEWRNQNPLGDAPQAILVARSRINRYHASGRDVMAVKTLMLARNAWRSYYSPPVNTAILAGTWTP